MKRAISLSIILVVLVISSYADQEQPLRTDTSTPYSRFSSGKNALRIPFDLYGGRLIYLQVRVNGSHPLWFILDTGASSGSFLNVKWVKPLGLQLQDKQVVSEPGGDVEMGSIKGVSLSLSGVDLFNQRLVTAPLSSLEPYVGRPLDGILGYDFISQFVVEINYADNVINLYDPQTYHYSGSGEIIPVTIEKNMPFVHLKLMQPGRETVKAKLELDTGSFEALGLNESFVKHVGLISPAQKQLVERGVAIGGETKGYRTRIKGIRIGRYLISNPVINVTTDAGGYEGETKAAGIIGGEILRRFKTILDCHHQQIILEKNSHFIEPYEYDMSGMMLIAEGPDFKVFKVHQILEHSPAAEADLREGDIITSINGRPTAEFTLVQVIQMFRQRGRHYSLNVRRGEKLIQAKIRMKRLI
jgi:hypothetical protein